MSEPVCVSCGGPRNHFVDGKLRPKCAACNDRSAGADRKRTGVTVFKSNREPAAATPQAIELLGRIDEMLEDERYEWAEGTLTGIRTTVERTGTVTEGQRRAIDNIEGAGMRGGRRW